MIVLTDGIDLRQVYARNGVNIAYLTCSLEEDPGIANLLESSKADVSCLKKKKEVSELSEVSANSISFNHRVRPRNLSTFGKPRKIVH